MALLREIESGGTIDLVTHIAEGSAEDPNPGAVVVNRALTIPQGELTWRFSTSGGPGGQHANTSNTKVDLRLDIEASNVLSRQQKHRLKATYGREVRVIESSQRSQLRNRETAIRRLAQLIRDGLRIRPRRVPTKPGRGATERRLTAKRQRSEVKRGRRGGDWD